MNIDAFLDHTGSFWRPAPRVGQDSSGAPVKVPQPIDGLGDLPCSLRPLDAKSRMQYQQRQMNVSHKVYFDRPLSLKRGDSFRTDHGHVYLVTGWIDTDDLEQLFVVLCEEQHD